MWLCLYYQSFDSGFQNTSVGLIGSFHSVTSQYNVTNIVCLGLIKQMTGRWKVDETTKLHFQTLTPDIKSVGHLSPVKNKWEGTPCINECLVSKTINRPQGHHHYHHYYFYYYIRHINVPPVIHTYANAGPSSRTHSVCLRVHTRTIQYWKTDIF